MSQINTDISVQSSPQTQKTSQAVGTLGKHSIQIGNNPPISLSKMPSAKIPFAGFRTATKVASAAKGVANNSATVVQTLTRPDGKLDMRKLLGSIKALQTHLDRQVQLGQLTRAAMDDAVLAAFAPVVEALSNNELSAVYQSFTSGEMSLLQEGLMREMQTSPGNRDAKAAAANLFNLEALVLKETSNRVAVNKGLPGADRLPTLSETYAGQSQVPVEHARDMSPDNLAVMVETAAQSATLRDRSASGVQADLRARNIQGIDARQIGDLLRASELTMNVDLDLLCGEASPLDHSDQPWENAFHLANRGVAPRLFTPTYMARRDAVEQTLFPELGGHEIRPDERPIYAALNPAQRLLGGAGTFYGKAVLVLKPEVAQRATYTADDTFLAARLTITPERREAFYKLVPALAGSISAGLAAALADASIPLTEARASFDQWLDDLAALPDPRAGNMSDLDRLLDCTNEEAHALEALCVKVFGDAAATRANTATFDSLESLVPNMGELVGAQLAHAAMRRQEGGDSRVFLSGLNYIEAQIQGPLVLNRDVAEIRIDSDELAYLPGGREKLLAWGEAHGVPVRLVSLTNSTESEDLSAIKHESTQYSAEHLDPQKVHAEADALRQSPEAAQQRIRAILHGNPPLFSAQALTLLGDEAPLQGAALGKALRKFQDAVDRALSHPDESMPTTEALVETCFRKAVLPLLQSKLQLLQDMEGLAFDNPAQKAAFRTWVLSAGALTRTDEMTMIHARSMEQCRLLQDLGTHPESAPAALDRFLACALATDRATAAHFKAIGFDDFGPDDSLTELNRVSFLSAAMLKALGGDTLEKARSVLDSPEMRAMGGWFQRLADPINGLLGNADFAAISSAMRVRDFTLSALCRELNAPLPQPVNEPRSFAQMPQEQRHALQSHFPHAVAELDSRHPYTPPVTLAPFPTALHPEALPQTHAERRQFLIHVLPTYLEHEQSFDQDSAVHGRGHVIRSFLFATAMANKLAESGVTVDRNAVLCGIAGHDMGREGNGTDIWEGQSARMTRDAMRSLYGADSMGEAYEKAFMEQIDGHSGNTAESMLLQAADSLDIGRTKDFDLERFPFLKEGVQAGQTFLAADPALREALAKEANLLQRITNPLVATRPILQQLTMDMANAAAGAEQYWNQIQHLKEGVREDFALQRQISDEELVSSMEAIIRDNPDLFPFLHQYYH